MGAPLEVSFLVAIEDGPLLHALERESRRLKLEPGEVLRRCAFYMFRLREDIDVEPLAEGARRPGRKRHYVRR